MYGWQRLAGQAGSYRPVGAQGQSQVASIQSAPSTKATFRCLLAPLAGTAPRGWSHEMHLAGSQRLPTPAGLKQQVLADLSSWEADKTSSWRSAPPPTTPQDPGRLGRATSGAFNRTWLIWPCTWRLNWASESTLHASTLSQAR